MSAVHRCFAGLGCLLVLGLAACDRPPTDVDVAPPLSTLSQAVPAGDLSTAGAPIPGRLSVLPPEAGPESAAVPVSGELSVAMPGPAAADGAVAASPAAAGPDLVWQRPSAGETFIWHGTQSHNGFTALQQVPVGWEIAGAGDFTGNGSPDLVWQHVTTGDRVIWHMDGRSWTGVFTPLPQVAADWRIVAVADFTGNGTPDLVWEHRVTLDRYIWHMGGATWTGAFTGLPQVAVEWRVVGAGDFDRDGKPDLVWQNTATGQRALWLMNGTAVKGYAMLPVVATDWRIAGVADFNNDGNVDLVWQNLVTGQRSIWYMDGTSYAGSYALLQTVDPTWLIVAVRVGIGVMTGPRTWTAGAGTTSWSTAGNWSSGLVPTPEDSVLILAAAPAMPALTGAVSVRGVRVESGATLALGAHDLTVTGNVRTGATGGITGAAGRLVVTGSGGTLEGVVPRLVVRGSYSLTGNLTVKAPLSVDLGQLAGTSAHRISVTSY
jgi:hypothetical protein